MIVAGLVTLLVDDVDDPEAESGVTGTTAAEAVAA